MRALLIALLLSFVESAVRMVENRYSGEAGKVKRLAAYQYVMNRVDGLQRIVGPLGVEVDKSVVLGLIDSTVEELHRSEEFETHTTEERHYVPVEAVK